VQLVIPLLTHRCWVNICRIPRVRNWEGLLWCRFQPSTTLSKLRVGRFFLCFGKIFSLCEDLKGVCFEDSMLDVSNDVGVILSFGSLPTAL